MRFWRKGYDRLYRSSRQQFIYSKCFHCHLVFLSSRPPEADAYKFYPKEYGPYQPLGARENSQAGTTVLEKTSVLARVRRATLRAMSALNSTVARIAPDSLAEDLQTLYRPPRPGARLLDFGCGTDIFLNHAREQGWDTLGMDISPQTVEQVRGRGHKAFLVSPSVWDHIENESLDLVRMNHVLEHLYNPREVMASIRAKMRRGGKLYLAIPNPDSLTSRIFGSRWFGLDCPRHVILYSPSVLKTFLERVGFSDVQIKHETVTKDFSRSLAYLFHDLGLITHGAIQRMGNSHASTALLFAPARLAAMYRAADRFHVFACK
jgi:2-polyprenyl-3-methyl-5-hydroxy-6-metoxy-1,4-benzoquinol methylase